MEGTEAMSLGVTVIGAEAPSNYHVAARTENSTQVAGATVTGECGVGRNDRKEEESQFHLPLVTSPAGKRGRGRPVGSENKQRHKVGWDNLGDSVACSAGANFMPHMITVNAGEDVTMKIISFSQQGPRAICIISAVGSISNVTLRQPDSSGGTLTYEGRFDILQLSGSFTPTDIGGSQFSRTGGMSITLASPDGRVVGGTLGGLLIAASPVQVVVGSFLLSSQNENKPKKLKTDHSKVVTTSPGSAATTLHTFNMEKEPFNAQEQQNSASQKPNVATDNWATMQDSRKSATATDNWATMQDSRKSATDINISLLGE
ncbi:hypothetical protein F0562_019123 [Nyssa sinensis]|uniref:AT-hook motif nuclear-localized protein n=1 Tax=Nyssa sinensis TaxID=561372 RepID=A0A5J4ZDR9_9ASTE|nr:hypothetical protein F0562_019123 [Nyssa sinensis]